jgi:hypothetical protein
MHAQDWAAPNHVAKDNFVDIKSAEAARQATVLEEFKAKNADLYARAVESKANQLRTAKQAEVTKRELVLACPQGKLNDLLVSIERDALVAFKLQSLPKVPEPAKLPEPILASAIPAGDQSKPAPEGDPVRLGGTELKRSKKSA